jgi:hypothetical protein
MLPKCLLYGGFVSHDVPVVMRGCIAVTHAGIIAPSHATFTPF